MRLVIQRVTSAQIHIQNQLTASIGKGLLVLVGICEADDHSDADWLAAKLVQMRIFNDENGKMNLALADVGGELLLVSQFTLFAETKKGNRPSFIQAARPEQAIPIYEHFIAVCTQLAKKTPATGSFGADMQVSLINDGPVTIIIDSKMRE